MHKKRHPDPEARVSVIFRGCYELSAYVESVLQLGDELVYALAFRLYPETEVVDRPPELGDGIPDVGVFHVVSFAKE